MGYIVPSSKIVFTDFMILLVSVLMGLNSVMSFTEKDRILPPVNLPKLEETSSALGTTRMKKPVITIHSKNKGLAYFLDSEGPLELAALIHRLGRAGTNAVVLRGDRETPFQWQSFCQLTAALRETGVKEIQYLVNGGKEKRL